MKSGSENKSVGFIFLLSVDGWIACATCDFFDISHFHTTTLIKKTIYFSQRHFGQSIDHLEKHLEEKALLSEWALQESEQQQWCSERHQISEFSKKFKYSFKIKNVWKCPIKTQVWSLNPLCKSADGHVREQRDVLQSLPSVSTCRV